MVSATPNSLYYSQMFRNIDLGIQAEVTFNGDQLSRNMIIGGVILLSAGTIALLWNNASQKQNNQANSFNRGFQDAVLRPIGVTSVACGVVSIASGYLIRSIAARASKKESTHVPTETF